MIIMLYQNKRPSAFSSTFQIMTTVMGFEENKLFNLKLSLKNVIPCYSGAANLGDFKNTESQVPLQNS